MSDYSTRQGSGGTREQEGKNFWGRRGSHVFKEQDLLGGGSQTRSGHPEVATGKEGFPHAVGHEKD